MMALEIPRKYALPATELKFVAARLALCIRGSSFAKRRIRP